MTEMNDPADDPRAAQLMKRVRDAEPTPTTPLSELWPDIKSRIERRRVVPVRHWMLIGSVAAAAAVVVLAVGLTERQRAATEQAAVVSAAADSISTYRDEAQALLDRLELERSMLRPEALSRIDHDLAVVDSAIAETHVAIARDPRNPLLQQMLALSYARKVEILKRASNAG